METSPIRLGNFLLLEQLAANELGEVWRGVHPEQGIAVAVKIAGLRIDWGSRAHAAYRQEMRGLAGIDHQGVIHLFDHGVVGKEGKDRLREGAPYTVLEYASGGSLGARSTWTWLGIKTTLLELLDALAHCHSRGLIHRGLRPSNVLICTEDDMRPGLKISDVGLSDLYRQLKVNLPDNLYGWLTPEQLASEHRDFGPWTDLYALGSLAFWMATGEAPFKGRETAPRGIPSLHPLMPVPPGFVEWVARLLDPDIGQRYERASDAAWRLVNLGVPSTPSRVRAQRVRKMQRMPPRPIVDFDQLEPDEDTTSEEVLPGDTDDEQPTAALYLPVGQVRSEVPPVPDSWRRADAPPLSLPTMGTGLRLFSMRHVPMVGRDGERDTLWRELLMASRQRRCRAVVIRGPAGVGKSRLVQWLCERAHEVGAASVIATTLGPESVPGEAIQRMVGNFLHAERLDRLQVENRVQRVLERLGVSDEDDVAAVSELLSPTGRVIAETTDAEGRKTEESGLTRFVQLNGSEQRTAVATKLLARISAMRPVILVIEDVQWGASALAFAKRLLALEHPILIVLTCKDAALGDRPNEVARLEELLALPRSSEIELGPLTEEASEDLADRLLGREGTLARRVARGTGGNPLFAVELVYDWVEQGMLEIGGTGLILREDIALPARLEEVWANRIVKLVNALGDQACRYLELAAALGMRVDDEEWREVCDDPMGEHAKDIGLATGEIVFSPVAERLRFQLVDGLMSARLAIETTHGFTFSHSGVRRVIVGEAKREHRWGRAHLACSETLKRRADRGLQGTVERYGMHLLEAGRHEEAIRPLIRGVEERVKVVGFRPAMSLLDLVLNVLDATELPEADVRWGEVWLVRARLCFLRNLFDETMTWADRAITAAKNQEWTQVLQKGLFQRAQVSLRRGDLGGAEGYLRALQETLEEHYHPSTAGKTLFGLAAVARYRHQYDDALLLYGKACHAFNAGNHNEGAAGCWRDMAALELTLSNPQRAKTLYKRALLIYEQIGRRNDMANCINGLAEVARQEGDLHAAERGYLRALDLYERLGGGQVFVPRMNLGLVHLRREEYVTAAELLMTILEGLGSRGERRLEGHCRIALMVCASARWDWPAFDEHLTGAMAIHERTGFAEPDTGWCARLAGDLAQRAGQRSRAQQAWKFALGQYEAVENEEQVAALRLLVEQS